MKDVNKYPLYVKDQVLSAAHLNQTTSFLEYQQLLTRRKLIGTGIVCGLKHSFENNSIEITAGYGVTSEGYLIDFPEDKSYVKIKDYKLPDDAVYPPFSNASGKQVPLWELAENKETKGNNLKTIKSQTEKFWRDKVVLLFLEIEDEDLKNCIEGDCDNKGAIRNFNVKPLLIGMADLVRFFNRDGDTIEDINSAVMARYAIKEIVCPRFDVIANNLKTHNQIAESFKDNANSLLSPIGKSLAMMQVLYAQKLGVANSLTNAWAEAKKAVEKNKDDSEKVQQAYDYLCDLAAAINEFTNEAAEWMVTCHQDQDLFPQHLALGELKTLGKEIPYIFRNYFVYAPTTPLAHEKQESIKFYYERIWGMLTHFDLKEVDELKVVPSKYGEAALSKKAIPFYFNSNEKIDWNWLKKWNYKRSDYGQWKKNTYYYNAPEAFLDLDIEPYSFFRIEGHVGKNYRQALADVQNQINNYRLPIKVMTLSTGGVPLNANPIPDSKFQDLEAMFDAAKAELFCALQTPLCFISKVQFGGSAKKTAESSTMAGGAASYASATANFMSGFAATINSATAYKKAEETTLGRLSYLLEGFVITYTKGQFLSSKCSAGQGTLGGIYLNLVKDEPYKSQRLLDLVQSRSGLGSSAGQKILLYMLVTIDEIEELIGLIKPAALSNFKFDELKEFIGGFTYFLDVFIKLIYDLQKSDFDTPPYVDELSVWLKNLKSICSLRKIVSIINERRLRTLQLLESWKFENFSKKHPGLTHKAGVTRGGTFIMVFHSDTKNEEFEPYTLDPPRYLKEVEVLSVANLATGLSKKHEVKSYKMKVEQGGTQGMEKTLYQYAKAQGKTINKTNLNRFRELIFEIDKGEKKLPATDGIILFDFFLPYICCGDGGVEIIMPEPKVSISLEKREFCTNDEKNYNFTLSPEGGQVTGEGVIEEDGVFFFSPSAEDVKTGSITFNYVVQGRNASMNILVAEAPTVDFNYSLDSSPNGTFVSFENKSSNASNYLWEFGDDTGKTSVEENPTYFYPPTLQEAKVILTAKSKVCGDSVKTETIQLFEENYSLFIGKYREFCANDDQDIKVTIGIIGRGEEPFPFKGILKGKGITAPTAANKFYTFNPSKAGEGSYKLVYEIDGKAVAELNIVVKKPFAASFSAKVDDTSRTELFVAITNIKPGNAPVYNWFVNPSKPKEFEIRTGGKDFIQAVSREAVKGMKTFPIKMWTNIAPCEAEVTIMVTNPEGNGGTDGTTTIDYFDPKTGVKRYGDYATTINNISTNNRFKTALGTSLKTVAAANKVVTGIGQVLVNTTSRPKLLSGVQNAKIAKAYGKVLDDLSKAIPVLSSSANKKRITLIAEVYAKTYLSLVEVVFMQTKDLTKTSALYKVYSAANKQMERIAKVGLPTKTKNIVKATNSKAAAVANKTNVSGLATKLKTKL